MKKIIILALLSLTIFSCNDAVSTNPEDSNDASTLNKPGGGIVLPSTEVLFDYDGSSDNYITPGQSTGWIYYQPGSGDYELKFKFLRDIIVGNGGGGTYNKVRVIVKDGFNNTILDTWYTQTWPVEWYSHRPTFSPTLRSHKVKVIVPNDYDTGLEAVITLYRNSTH